MSAAPAGVDISALTSGPALGWGVVGAGRIAADFVRAVHRFTGQRVVAVTDAVPGRAETLAARAGLRRACRSLDALLGDPSVDVVYVAVTNDAHVPTALRCVDAGKAVLVEKPLARSADEAAALLRAAQDAGVFVAEAMWSRYLPHVRVLEGLLDAGVVGELRWVAASAGGAHRYDPNSRLFDPAMGGGALLDVGVYPLWLVSAVLGPPTRLHATGLVLAGGVDVQSVLTLEYEAARAVVSSAIVAPLPDVATVVGERGAIAIEPPFFAPSALEIRAQGRDRWRWVDDSGLAWRDGMAWQAAAVAGYVAEGRHESPRVPLADSLAILGMVDDATRQLRASGSIWTPRPDAVSSETGGAGASGLLAVPNEED